VATPLPDLPLFHGDHVPGVRFERALAALDLSAALADCPARWRPALTEMAGAVAGGDSGRADLARLLSARSPGWPPELERTWQRLVGRRLDGFGIPERFGDELAAEYLLRGGERHRAEASLRRHLRYHPADARAWALLAPFEPLPAAARAGFHLGAKVRVPVELVPAVVDAVEDDEHAEVAPWLVAYAWLTGALGTPELVEAVDAEGLRDRPMLLPDGAHAFTFYLVEAETFRCSSGATSAEGVEARRRLKRISPSAYTRYLRRTAG
jgi:hypothetical protein